MDEENKKSKGFGFRDTWASESHQKNLFKLFLKITLIVVGVAIAPLAFKGWRGFYFDVLEKGDPSIVVDQIPYGVGLNPVQIQFRVGDTGSGLKRVAIHISDGIKNHVIQEFDYSKEKKKADLINFTFDAKKNNLKQGEVRLVIEAEDRSFWHNKSFQSAVINVDYLRPEIKILNKAKQTFANGETALATYQVKDDAYGFSGVRSVYGIFPGFSGVRFGSSFVADDNLFLAFIPVVIEEESEGNQEIIATDKVGNIAIKTLPWKFISKAKKIKRIDISPQQLQLDFEKYSKILNKAQEEEKLPKNASLEEKVKLLFCKQEEILQEKTKVLFSRPSQERFWKGLFRWQRDLTFEPDGFYQRFSYYLNGVEICQADSLGLDFKIEKGKEIEVTNHGLIIFAGELGVLGKTVIVDHGFGITTVYANLSLVLKEEGNQVIRGDVIGLSGTATQLIRTGYHYQLRVHGIAVDPQGWQDRSKMFGKLNDILLQAKKSLKK